MPSPTDRNRLAQEESPYLQAHADNPVHWQPWDETALDAARERDVPIFLSIGYAACHWCHVMAEESFEDESIAAQLNENFVPIKLDREERPDIDSIYMTVCQLTNRGGCGWPLSVWLTPEGEPFFVGTYFPKEPRRGQPGFGDILDDITDEWQTNRDALESRARQWMQAARSELEATPVPAEDEPDSELVADATESLVQQADRQYGGFGSGQKFPQPSRLELLALASALDVSPVALDVLTETLDAMAEGGLRDHLGGGFHRYCVDREWVVPHFEKMLYDNAGIARAFLTGYTLTGTDRYADIAEETFDFVESELTHPGGAFYSTLDARSKPVGDAADAPGRGVEGAYYVWTPEQVSSAIDSGDGSGSIEDGVLDELLTARYGITQAGNFEGRTVLTIAESIESLAQAFDRDPETIADLLSIGDDRLRSARADRPRPPRDEKVLAGWNGLMIDALAEGALVLQDETYARRANAALEFVRDHLWDGSALARRYKDPADDHGGDSAGVKGDGMLEDYAFLARGALTLYEATGSLDALVFALELSRAMKRRFWDPDRRTIFYTPVDGEDLPVRPQELADQSTPSSTGVALEVLVHMHAFAPEESFDEIVSTVLRTHGERIRKAPMQHPSLVRVADLDTRGHLEVTISAEEPPDDWMAYLGREFLPDRLLAHRPPDDTALEEWLRAMDLADVPPIWAGRAARSGPTGYVCRRACSPPVTELGELADWVDSHRSRPE